MTRPRRLKNRKRPPGIRRKKILEILSRPRIQKAYARRSIYVEPMQGIVKDIFELDRCWRGIENNRWLFAAMGVAVQMAQWEASLKGRSTWKIKQMVLG
ncbi:MAG: hypothetical protein ACK44H_02685 [Candidatus Kryptonium sp.]